MGQPIKKEINKKPTKIKLKTTKEGRIRAIRKKMKERQKEEYGTSKLEEKFSKEFLDKLGIEYIYQYKVESIGRYYDFYIPSHRICIEVDGDYYHSYGLNESEMNKMQKHNKMVDKIKDKWCSRNGIVLVRLWEHEINNESKKVMDYLKYILNQNKPNNMDKRH